jgi:hypothetical protein
MDSPTPISLSGPPLAFRLDHRPRSWNAQVCEPVYCELPDGEHLTLLTGTYTLRELTSIEYELMTRLGEAIRVRLSDIETLRAGNQLMIEGSWP